MESIDLTTLRGTDLRHLKTGPRLQRLLTLAHAAQRAYEGGTSKTYTDDGYEVTPFSFPQRRPLLDTEAVLLHDDDVAVLAFRGTETGRAKRATADWWTNVKFKLGSIETARGAQRVHHGFARALEIGWETIAEALGRRGSGKTVWLTGHSLGGALATLAALKLMPREGHLAGTALCTFGQPRVGTTAMRSMIESGLPERAHRVVNNDDIVTRVPPSKILPYEHAGGVYHLADGRMRFSPTDDIPRGPIIQAEFDATASTLLKAVSDAKKRKSESTWDLAKRLMSSDPLQERLLSLLGAAREDGKDHGIAEYIAALEALRE